MNRNHIAMDKQERKNLKKQYKEDAKKADMKKLLNSECSWIKTYAQLELREPLPPITKETIEKADNGFDLTEALNFMIQEKVLRDNPDIKSIISSRMEDAVNGLSNFLQIIYHTFHFESMIGIGDIDKEFTCYRDLEKAGPKQIYMKLKAAFSLMNCQQMVRLIEKAEKTQDYDKLQEISRLYDPNEVDEKRLKFIKSHWLEYIIS